MKSYHILPLILLLIGCNIKEKKSYKEDESLRRKIENIFNLAEEQYLFMSQELDSARFPKTFENGELKTSGSGWWCSGFYPGTLAYIYKQTKNPQLLKELEKSLDALENEKHNMTTHDLGFMMHCSFGNAYRFTGNEKYRRVIHTSAQSLATRFNTTTKTIRSWDAAPWNEKWEYPVIIDNMMNLEMLLWAGKRFNDSIYTKIALTHANTTLENHFREDFSSYHVVSYDTVSGEVEIKNTDQGYADESSWARGQAWGLYGYTIMYRYTRDQIYLDQALGIADFIINHPNFPKDGIPYWDFDAPDIPNVKRDASAAAIISSALLELLEYVDSEKGVQYFETAKQILETLSSSEYLAEKETNGGFLLKHCVGNMPDGTEVDVPLSYADYYFVEAMSRFINTDYTNDPVGESHPTIFDSSNNSFAGYLFAYFSGNGPDKEQVHYAISKDGYNYKALNNNMPVIDSKEISTSGGVRDPHILRGNDSGFYMVLTDLKTSEMGWQNTCMVLLKSSDLINWTHSIINIPKTFPEKFGNVNRVWAPQTIYDPKKEKYMIYWSMRHNVDPDIIYYAYANDDFTGLDSEPKQLLFRQGASIDGDIVYKNGEYHLFFKNEDQGAKGILKAVSNSINKDYMIGKEYVDQTDAQVEGSGTFQLIGTDKYILMYDVYIEGKYQFCESSDLENFKVVDKDVTMDFHPRHGSVVPITKSELSSLLAEWKTFFIQTHKLGHYL